MADTHELLFLPNQGDSSIVLSETRSSLAARGRKDAANLKLRNSKSFAPLDLMWSPRSKRSYITRPF